MAGIDLRGPSTVNAAYARFRQNTLAYLGDSIVNFNTVIDDSATSHHQNSRGFGHWLNAISRQAFHVVGSFGYSGYTSAQILAQLPNALATNPRYLFVLAGVNSVNSGVAASSITADLQAIITQATAQGAHVVIGTLWPSTATLGVPANLAINDQVNNWIIQEASHQPGVTVVPWHKDFIDPTTGGAKTNYTEDGTHPTSLGAAVLGQSAWNVLGSFVSSPENLPYYSGDATNLVTNALMTGTTGLLNAVTNAGVATSWKITTTGTITVVPTKVAPADGVGSWQQIQITAGGGSGSSDYAELEFDSASVPASGGYINRGDTIYGLIEFETDADFANATMLQMRIEDPSTGFKGQALQAGDSTDRFRLASVKGIMQTPSTQVSATNPTVRMFVRVGGLNAGSTATLRVRRAAIKKLVTTDGLV